MDLHPEPFIHHPSGKHTHTLICLHGTSQTGPSFAENFLSFKFPYPSPSTPSPSPSAATTPPTPKTLPELFPTTKFLFPTGSPKPLTVFGGALSNAWFDIHDFGDRTKGESDQLVDMKESAIYLLSLIQQENEILAREGLREGEGEGEGEGDGKGKVGLLGFSQGCAMGVLMVLSGVLDPLLARAGMESEEEREEGKVRASLGTGGVTPFIGMSGWLPFRAQIENVLDQKGHPREYIRTLLDLDSASSPAGSPWNILLVHGADDVKVKLEWALQLREIVPRILGPEARVASAVLDGLAHWWNEEELASLVRFLKGAWNLD